jgi:hypothetical protein
MPEQVAVPSFDVSLRLENGPAPTGMLMGFEIATFYDNAYDGTPLEIADYVGDWGSTTDGAGSSVVVATTANAYNKILYKATQSMVCVCAGHSPA